MFGNDDLLWRHTDGFDLRLFFELLQQVEPFFLGLRVGRRENVSIRLTAHNALKSKGVVQCWITRVSASEQQQQQQQQTRTVLCDKDDLAVSNIDLCSRLPLDGLLGKALVLRCDEDEVVEEEHMSL